MAAGAHAERCSFCKKPPAEVGFLIAGPGVSICDGCVLLSAAIVVERRGGTVPPEDARCAKHPLEPAVLVCPRCGAFACVSCTSGGKAAPLCAACQARIIPPPPVVASPPPAPAAWRAHPAFFVCTGLVVGVLLVYLILGLS